MFHLRAPRIRHAGNLYVIRFTSAHELILRASFQYRRHHGLLWSGDGPSDVASPESFASPHRVFAFYESLRLLIAPGSKARDVDHTDRDHSNSPPHTDVQLRHHHWMWQGHVQFMDPGAEDQDSVNHKQHSDK